MRRTRASRKQINTNCLQESSDEEPKQKKTNKKQTRKVCDVKDQEGSSSESDIENYLKPTHKIDLNSSFFDLNNPEPQFNVIEKNIFSGVVNKLSESESDDEQPLKVLVSGKPEIVPKLNFQQLNDYMQKIEDAKEQVSKYEAKKALQQKSKNKTKQRDETNLDVASLLKLGEKKSPIAQTSANSQEMSYSEDSDDFESMSEAEDWEEVKEVKEKNIIPKEGVQITVQMPNLIRKKKGIDLLTAMKRRINRIKKENQVLIHKVHLLCWIAHGNFINRVLNSEEMLGLSLSLIPSEKCYPSDRPDLNYLEQILGWYRKTIELVEKKDDITVPMEKKLQTQIAKKQAYSKRMLAFIFICILRSLGIQCRLVMSLQPEPLRPPSNELCSLSSKTEDKTKNKDANQKKNDSNRSIQNKMNTSQQKIADVEKEKTKTKKKPENKNKKEAKDDQDIDQMVSKETKLKTLKEPSKIGDKDQLKTEAVNQKTSKTSKNAEQKGKSKIKPSKHFPENLKENEQNKQRTDENSVAEGNTAKVKNGSSKTSGDTKDHDGNKNKLPKTVKPNLLKIKLPLKSKSSKEKKNQETKIPQVDGNNDSEDDIPSTSKQKPKLNLKKIADTEINTCPIKKHPSRLKSAPPSYKEVDSEEEFHPRTPFTKKSGNVPPPSKTNLKKLKEPAKSSISASTSKCKYFAGTPKKQLDVRSDIINLMKSSIIEQKQKDRSKLIKKPRQANESESDSDWYYPEPIKKKQHDSEDEFISKSKTKVKRRVQVRKDESLDQSKSSKKSGVDVWMEVFLEAEEKWITVDVVKGQVHCVQEVYKRATHPVSYIIAWNNDSRLKDITKRYCPDWNTVTRKLRVDAKWWEETLKPFIGRKTAIDREEDEELARQQMDKPLPTTISEYKNHPLYVLKRHLLKFEAIYPPNAVTLGFVRNEPVYSRQCVYTLHSREIWLKHAKVVKPGEKPYKIVKARPKYDKLSNSVITDQLLEIFGVWQVDDYVPPVAENGIVPRNAYGNVELFKACMLPKGTVHLQLPGLNKVARKLNIDCAPAVVGFDFHSGWSHPTFDGFVVCEEYAEILTAAWEQEQEEAEKRAQEKIDKRVYDNWRRLIRGLLIRERLKVKYNFDGPSTSGSNGKNKRPLKGPSFVVKKKQKISDRME